MASRCKFLFVQLSIFRLNDSNSLVSTNFLKGYSTFTLQLKGLPRKIEALKVNVSDVTVSCLSI